MKSGALKLPHRVRAKVERAKVYDYLLNPEHRYGGSKAEFFLQLGFNRKNWKTLQQALCVHARSYPVVSMVETDFGPQFVIEGSLQCPDGRQTLVRSVWQIDVGKIAPRLITSYPLEQDL
jgi:hypothetical protein